MSDRVHTSFTSASFQHRDTTSRRYNITAHEATEDETEVLDDCVFSQSVFSVCILQPQIGLSISTNSKRGLQIATADQVQSADYRLQTGCKTQTENENYFLCVSSDNLASVMHSLFRGHLLRTFVWLYLVCSLQSGPTDCFMHQFNSIQFSLVFFIYTIYWTF